MAIVYLGIGSNIGDKEKNCAEALRLLAEIDGAEIAKRSEFYLTKPVGGPRQEDYLNGVVEVKTNILPERLLIRLKDIERKMGRDLDESRDRPRVIDLDILTYGDSVFKSEKLTIPHLRMHERYFVLRGFNEIAPDVIHPTQKKSIKDLYGSCDKSE